MGTPRRFVGANLLLKGNGDNVLDMHVRNNGGVLWSCWALTDAEIAEINRTRLAWVGQWAGGAAPMPLRLAGHRTEVFPDEKDEPRFLIMKPSPIPRPDSVIALFHDKDEAIAEMRRKIKLGHYETLTLWSAFAGTAIMTICRDDEIDLEAKVDTRTLADKPGEG